MFYMKWIDFFRIVFVCHLVVGTGAQSCQLLIFQNGEVEYSGLVPGSTAAFRCHAGYRLLGTTSIQCLEGGLWSDTVPSCQRITCGVPPFISNGHYEMTDDKTSATVRYFCLTGYALLGNETRQCLENGSWSGSSPTCARSCPFPPNASFAQIIQLPASLYFPAGIYINYECHSGFKLDPFQSHSVRCQEDFMWSEMTEFCTRVSCGMPENIINGNVNVTDTLFGSTANYSCIDGYILIGSTERNCTADAVWSDNAPKCIPISVTTISVDSTPHTESETTTLSSDITDTTPPMENKCQKIQAIEEDINKCTSTPEDWIKYLQIEYFYLQIENLKLDIKNKKNEG